MVNQKARAPLAQVDKAAAFEPVPDKSGCCQALRCDTSGKPFTLDLKSFGGVLGVWRLAPACLTLPVL